MNRFGKLFTSASVVRAADARGVARINSPKVTLLVLIRWQLPKVIA
jgi:hypothetical protein